MPTITPKKLDTQVRAFCRDVTRHSPVYVEVAPEHCAAASECFVNVNSKIKRDGGAILYGWSIWIWPGVYIEAEHHAVWEGPDKRLTDVTPCVSGEKRILFVPDPEQSYDYATHRRRDNVRRPLTSDRDVSDFLSLAERIMAIIENNSEGQIATIPYDEIKELTLRQKHHYIAMLRKFLRPNDRCPCGKGRKFKVCCMADANSSIWRL